MDESPPPALQAQSTAKLAAAQKRRRKLMVFGGVLAASLAITVPVGMMISGDALLVSCAAATGVLTGLACGLPYVLDAPVWFNRLRRFSTYGIPVGIALCLMVGNR